jgi:hypothetical protein
MSSASTAGSRSARTGEFHTPSRFTR